MARHCHANGKKMRDCTGDEINEVGEAFMRIAKVIEKTRESVDKRIQGASNEHRRRDRPRPFRGVHRIRCAPRQLGRRVCRCGGRSMLAIMVGHDDERDRWRHDRVDRSEHSRSRGQLRGRLFLEGPALTQRWPLVTPTCATSPPRLGWKLATSIVRGWDHDLRCRCGNRRVRSITA